MSKLSKAIAVLGVVAGLGVAALPMSTYAASTASKAAQVKVEVGGGISIAIVDPEEQIDGATLDTSDGAILDLGQVKIGGAPAEGKLGVKVTTNDPAGYTLSIAPLSASATAMVGNNGSEILAGTPAQGTSAWGFKGGDITSYQGFAENGAAVTLLENGSTVRADGVTTGNADQQTDITFGVSAKPTQLEGTYTANVTFIATVK